MRRGHGADGRRGIFAALIAFLFSCGGLSAIDAEGLRRSMTLDRMAYAHEDAATPAAALMRGAYCSDRGVARRHRLPVPEAGADIDCDGP